MNITEQFNVLSLFDGVSCGQLALQRAGIKYDKYFAAEIDKNAIKVTQYHFPDTVQLGDVTKVAAADLPKINLILAGSPCQSFSNSGDGSGFDGKSGLFFEFVRLLKEVRQTNPDVLFLLENVRMKKEWSDKISEILGFKPVEINSALVSAQSRRRLYWTNIGEIGQPEDKKLVFSDIAEHLFQDGIISIEDEIRKHIGSKSKYFNSFQWRRDSKGRILVSRPDGLKIQRIGRIAQKSNKVEIVTTLGSRQPFVCDGKQFRRITPLEAERLQTLPDNYTSTLPKNKRYHAIGNGWTVDVISHILSHIKMTKSL